MYHIWQNLLRVSPAISAIAYLVFYNGAVAVAETAPSLVQQIQQYNQEVEVDSLDQVTNVSQLRDVAPGDWAYEALRGLVERYGTIAGYPDGTFRGNRRMTRYEFAAALLRVFDGIQLQVLRGKNAPPPPELQVLEALTQEFVLELSLVRGEVDAATARIGELELTQFSTTTKLDGEAIIGLAGIVTGDEAIGDTTIFGNRTRLTLETSFTGRDELETRLEAEGLGELANRTQTPEGELAFTGDSDDNLKIETLQYSFPIGDRTQINIVAHGAEPNELVNTLNPYLDGDGGSGAISRFATRPPIYNLIGGAGVGVTHTFQENLAVSLGYFAGDANNPTSDGGLFNGVETALAQIVFQPNQQTTIGLTYINADNQDLAAGSQNANLFNQLGLPVTTNSLGIATSMEINPGFIVGGWAGYTKASVNDLGDANIWHWAVTLTFPDLGKKGNLAGFIIGMEPKVTHSDDSLRNLGINDPNTSLHLEAFYQYQLTDNIAITPGVIWLTARDHNRNNDDVLIGTVRTTFRF